MSSEDKVLNNVMNRLEEDLKYKFVNIRIIDQDMSGITVVVGFNHNDQFADSDVIRIKGEYFYADDDWSNVWEIKNINDFKKYIHSKNLVDIWNNQISENEAVILTDEVRDFVYDFLNNDSYRYIDELADSIEYEDEEEEIDVDDIFETVKSLKVKVNYDNDVFWEEEDLIEQWEYEVEGI